MRTDSLVMVWQTAQGKLASARFLNGTGDDLCVPYSAPNKHDTNVAPVSVERYCGVSGIQSMSLVPPFMFYLVTAVLPA